MKFTAQLNPISNPNVSNLSPQEQWTKRVNDKMNNRIPLNAPNVVSQSIQAQYVRGMIQTTQVSPAISTGIWEIGNRYNNQYLQAPTSYKLTQINDINLRANVSWQQTAPFTSAPSPDGDYTMYYYVTIEKQPQGLFTEEEYYLVFRYEFNYDNTAQEFSFSDNIVNIRLRDTIDTRQIYDLSGTNYPDFTNDPDKITSTQYTAFQTEDITLNAIAGFDLGQLGTGSTPNPVLSTNDKAHFEYFLYGNTTPANGQSFFDITTTIVFTYSGLFADFTPIS